jgi:predicted regulator of Ras-like GTPase activity (Roadblock/LC7/MglB family)
MPDGDARPLLADLVARVPGARSAALVGADGLVITEHGLGRDGGDQLSAITFGLITHARRASILFGSGDRVRQVAADCQDVRVHAVSAGTVILAVIAGRETDPGMLGTEMRRIAEAVRPQGTAGTC